jgi:hypothetical protein
MRRSLIIYTLLCLAALSTVFFLISFTTSASSDSNYSGCGCGGGVDENPTDAAISPTDHSVGVATTESYGGTIMKPSIEQIERWVGLYESAPSTILLPQTMMELAGSSGASLSLLDGLDYIPNERDQGVCGNCWAWAGTGVMEIGLNLQTGTKDRLSMQYLNSNFNGGKGSDWACCGGWLEDVEDFYAAEEMAIPWSNANAGYLDGSKTCGGSTSVSSNSISTNPNYPIVYIETEKIPTQGVGKEQAILNIKNVLHQGRAIWFGFFLPKNSDWDKFRSFWWNKPESEVWDPSFSCDRDWDNGGGHAVLCVGYDDTDPDDRYWVMLNSWGITSGRPNGLFRVDMDMDYDCAFYDRGWWYSFYWQTLDISYFQPSAPEVTNSNGATDITSGSAKLNCEVTDTGGENPTVRIYWGNNDGGSSPANWDHVIDLGTKGAETFSVQIDDLNSGTTYFYRCFASNSGGETWAESTASFKTLTAVNAPEVTNSNGATDITSSSAKLNGEVTDTGGENPNVHIYWGNIDGGSSPANWDHAIDLGTKGAETFLVQIDGLNSGTTYFYRCFASNSGGENWAKSTSSFITYPSGTQSKLIGADEASCDAVASGDYLYLSRSRAEHSGSVKTIKLKASGSGNVKVAIYEDNAGEPGALLTKVDVSTPVVAGWNDVIIPAAAVSKNDHYWLAFISDTRIGCLHKGAGPRKLKYADFDTFTFPENAGTGFYTMQSYYYLIAGWGVMDP